MAEMDGRGTEEIVTQEIKTRGMAKHMEKQERKLISRTYLVNHHRDYHPSPPHSRLGFVVGPHVSKSKQFGHDSFIHISHGRRVPFRSNEKVVAVVEALMKQPSGQVVLIKKIRRVKQQSRDDDDDDDTDSLRRDNENYPIMS